MQAESDERLTYQSSHQCLPWHGFCIYLPDVPLVLPVTAVFAICCLSKTRCHRCAQGADQALMHGVMDLRAAVAPARVTAPYVDIVATPSGHMSSGGMSRWRRCRPVTGQSAARRTTTRFTCMHPLPMVQWVYRGPLAVPDANRGNRSDRD